MIDRFWPIDEDTLLMGLFFSATTIIMGAALGIIYYIYVGPQRTLEQVHAGILLEDTQLIEKYVQWDTIEPKINTNDIDHAIRDANDIIQSEDFKNQWAQTLKEAQVSFPDSFTSHVSLTWSTTNEPITITMTRDGMNWVITDFDQ